MGRGSRWWSRSRWGGGRFGKWLKCAVPLGVLERESQLDFAAVDGLSRTLATPEPAGRPSSQYESRFFVAAYVRTCHGGGWLFSSSSVTWPAQRTGQHVRRGTRGRTAMLPLGVSSLVEDAAVSVEPYREDRVSERVAGGPGSGGAYRPVPNEHAVSPRPPSRRCCNNTSPAPETTGSVIPPLSIVIRGFKFAHDL